MKKQIVIYGGGPFAELMHTYFTRSGREISAFCVDREFLVRDELCGLPVVAFEDVRDKCPPSKNRMFAAVGYKRMAARKEMFDRARESGYQLVSYIDSHANVSDDCATGDNNVIMGGVHIEPSVKIGNNNIIWSDTLLCHDLTMGDHNFIAGKCAFSGNCFVEDLCFVGTGVTVIDGIRLCRETHLFPGSVVYHDTRPNGRYAGNPAARIGDNPCAGIVIDRSQR